MASKLTKETVMAQLFWNKENRTLVDCPLTTAYTYANIAHLHQVRKYTGEPYITHPVAVATILEDYKKTCKVDINMQVAALLHDTIEDTCVTLDDIVELFGIDVAYLVDGLTDPSSQIPELEQKNRVTRKLADGIHTSNGDDRIKLIKSADRLHNLGSIIQHGKPDYVRTYIEETRKLVAYIGDNPITRAIKLKIDRYNGKSRFHYHLTLQDVTVEELQKAAKLIGGKATPIDLQKGTKTQSDKMITKYHRCYKECYWERKAVTLELEGAGYKVIRVKIEEVVDQLNIHNLEDNPGAYLELHIKVDSSYRKEHEGFRHSTNRLDSNTKMLNARIHNEQEFTAITSELQNIKSPLSTQYEVVHLDTNYKLDYWWAE
jgi:hypothetical protein